MKKTAILNIGRRYKISEESYKDQAESISDLLNLFEVPVRVFTEITSEIIETHEVFIFLCGDMAQKAKEIKAEHPEKIVMLLTGLIEKEYKGGEIIIFDKGILSVEKDIFPLLR